MTRIRKIKRRVKSVVLGLCPVDLGDDRGACGRPLLYSFEVNLKECIECRNRRRWAQLHDNPDTFASRNKASFKRYGDLKRKAVKRAILRPRPMVPVALINAAAGVLS